MRGEPPAGAPAPRRPRRSSAPAPGDTTRGRLSEHVTERSARIDDVLLFLATLGAALSAIGETVDAVETRLAVIARRTGCATPASASSRPRPPHARPGARPRRSSRRRGSPRRRGSIRSPPSTARRAGGARRGRARPPASTRLDEIRRMDSRFGDRVERARVRDAHGRDRAHPASGRARRRVRRRARARSSASCGGSARGRRTVEALMPFLAAFCVAAIVALAGEARRHRPRSAGDDRLARRLHPGRRADHRLPRADRGTDGRGRRAGSSGAATQLGLLAFGIVAGIGDGRRACAERAFSSSDALLGCVGAVARRARVRRRRDDRPLGPARGFPSLLVVLYAAWTGQVVGNELFGAYASGFTGALVMTLAAYLLARLPSTMPVYAMFLPGFWLLVPARSA